MKTLEKKFNNVLDMCKELVSLDLVKKKMELSEIGARQITINYGFRIIVSEDSVELQVSGIMTKNFEEFNQTFGDNTKKTLDRCLAELKKYIRNLKTEVITDIYKKKKEIDQLEDVAKDIDFLYEELRKVR